MDRAKTIHSIILLCCIYITVIVTSSYTPKRPSWERDYKIGEMYYDEGRYYQAVKYYKRAFNLSEKNNNAIRKEISYRIMSCYAITHNETKKVEYAKTLLKYANATSDESRQAIALFNIGNSEYKQNNKADGYKNMENAALTMASANYKYKNDSLHYYYNTLLNYYVQDKCKEKALWLINESEAKAAEDAVMDEFCIDSLEEKDRKIFYARRAVAMNLLGRDTEADELYQKFCSLGTPNDSEQEMIMLYLFGRKMYNEIIRICRLDEQRHKESGDTINYHYINILNNLAKANSEIGDYKDAANYYAMIAILRDSIKNRDLRDAANNIVESYDSAEKEITELKHFVLNIILIIAAVTGIILVILVILIIYYKRKIRLIDTKPDNNLK